MTNISQKPSLNILKPLNFVCRLGFTGLCAVWPKRYFCILSCFHLVNNCSLCIKSFYGICPF